MDAIKQWTLNICLTLICAVILSLISPTGSMGRFYKTVLSLFIITGFLLPFTGEHKFDFSAFTSQSSVQTEDLGSVYQKQIEQQVRQVLNAAGFKNCMVQAQVSVRGQEINIESLQISVPGDTDKTTVQAVIEQQLGLRADVKGMGE